MSLQSYSIALLLFVTFVTGCDSGDVTPEIERSYTKSIVREADSDFEADLITAAETTYPPRDSVLAVLRPEQREGIPETGYWYYSSFDGVLIPFAITADAVAYYSNLIDELESGKKLQFLMKATFEYRASVTFEETYTFEDENPMSTDIHASATFEKVYVVRMALNWYQYCGPICAMWIDHERVVVFDESGAVIQVFLDGPHPVAVS